MHSYLLNAGFVMRMNMTQNTVFTHPVTMEYSLGQTAALGCQIRYLLSYMLQMILFFDCIAAPARFFLFCEA